MNVGTLAGDRPHEQPPDRVPTSLGTTGDGVSGGNQLWTSVARVPQWDNLASLGQEQGNHRPRSGARRDPVLESHPGRGHSVGDGFPVPDLGWRGCPIEAIDPPEVQSQWPRVTPAPGGPSEVGTWSGGCLWGRSPARAPTFKVAQTRSKMIPRLGASPASGIMRADGVPLQSSCLETKAELLLETSCSLMPSLEAPCSLSYAFPGSTPLAQAVKTRHPLLPSPAPAHVGRD